MSTAGIDFDTHAVHVVLLEDSGAATYHRFELQGHDAFERTRSVGALFGHLSSKSVPLWWNVEAVGIEEPQGAQRATVAKLKAVQGAILACLPRELLVQPLQPAQWRVACGLPGNASKEQVRDFADRFWWNTVREWEPWIHQLPQDAADAYCIALAVSRMVVTA